MVGLYYNREAGEPAIVTPGRRYGEGEGGSARRPAAKGGVRTAAVGGSETGSYARWLMRG